MEVITRTDTGWRYHEYGYGEAFLLESIDTNISVADIYRRLTIPTETRRSIPIEIQELDDEPENE
jgi:hypothetical protein